LGTVSMGGGLLAGVFGIISELDTIMKWIKEGVWQALLQAF